MSQSTLLHNMRNTSDLDNSVPWPGEGHPDAMKMSCRQGYFHTRLISRAVSGLRARLPSNWRMKVEAEPASSVGVLDALLLISAQTSKPQSLAALCNRG